MRHRYDDLSQETWNSADDNMPQAELDRRLKLFRELQPLKYPPSELKQIEARLRERERRRTEEFLRRFNEEMVLVDGELADGSPCKIWVQRKRK